MKPEPVLLLTRSAAETQNTEALVQAGIEVIHVPVTKITPLPESLSRFPASDAYHGLFFSSRWGAEIFYGYLAENNRTDWSATPIYTLSGAVSRFLEDLRQPVTFCSPRHSLKGFLETCPVRKNGKWIHPCSTETLLNSADFKKIGVQIENFPVYAPKANSDSAEELAEALKKSRGIVFYSGSAVENFLALAWPEGLSRWASGLKIFSWGQSAASRLGDHNIPHIILDPCGRDWVETIIRHLNEDGL